MAGRPDRKSLHSSHLRLAWCHLPQEGGLTGHGGADPESFCSTNASFIFSSTEEISDLQPPTLHVFPSPHTPKYNSHMQRREARKGVRQKEESLDEIERANLRAVPKWQPGWVLPCSGASWAPAQPPLPPSVHGPNFRSLQLQAGRAPKPWGHGGIGRVVLEHAESRRTAAPGEAPAPIQCPSPFQSRMSTP